MQRVDRSSGEEAAAPSATLAVAAVVASSRPSNGAWRAALLVSAILHGALLAAAIMALTSVAPGGRGTALEGIEIEIISAAALESLMRPPEAIQGGAASLAEQPGQPATATDSPPASQQAPAAPDRAVIAAPTAETDVPATDPQPRLETVPAAAPTQSSNVAAVSTDTGGATAEATVATPQQSASAGAAPGDVARYAADVRRVLSRSRPKANWPSGGLLVAFTVSERGDVARTDLRKPSGNSRLDALALQWIGAARFPTPPSGMSLDQRTYEIPLTIRGAKR